MALMNLASFSSLKALASSIASLMATIRGVSANKISKAPSLKITRLIGDKRLTDQFFDKYVVILSSSSIFLARTP